MGGKIRVINPRGDERCILNAGQALRISKRCLTELTCKMFNSQHLHLIASIDNAVFILIVLFSPPAVRLEGVIVDATWFLFQL